MFQGFRESVKSVNGADIAFVTAGSGPPVLLLHGFPQTKEMWSKVAPLLAARFSIVCADLRGYGRSSKPLELADHSNYSFRAMAQDQVALMRSLGHERFHVVGHDRGGRTAHRMALDHPEVVASLSVLDIVPTSTMFLETNRDVAMAYWHWYFLAQPSPLPEQLIEADPDFFFETCLVGWGKQSLADFDPEQLAAYRAAWREPQTIHGMCSDYRAAATVDLALDTGDLHHKVACPVLSVAGSRGVMAQLYDIPGEWQKRATNLTAVSLPGGHFFIDHMPQETAEVLGAFLDQASGGAGE